MNAVINSYLKWLCHKYLVVFLETFVIAIGDNRQKCMKPGARAYCESNEMKDFVSDGRLDNQRENQEVFFFFCFLRSLFVTIQKKTFIGEPLFPFFLFLNFFFKFTEHFLRKP